MLLLPTFNFLVLYSNPIKRGYSQIRSSAWLEHYTDNVGVTSSNLVGSTFDYRSLGTGDWIRNVLFLFLAGMPAFAKAPAAEGGLAQLARALALQAKGHRFDSDILHINLSMDGWTIHTCLGLSVLFILMLDYGSTGS